MSAGAEHLAIVQANDGGGACMRTEQHTTGQTFAGGGGLCLLQQATSGCVFGEALCGV